MIILKLDDGTGGEYDRALHENRLPVLASAEQTLVVTKDGGTKAGRPVMMIQFEVELPDHTRAIAQQALTLGEWMMAVAGMKGRYGEPPYAAKCYG